METSSKSWWVSFFITTSSYPTYEEWKLELLKKNKDGGIKSSYPTYEEWKPKMIAGGGEPIETQFLSYLWGMETK